VFIRLLLLANHFNVPFCCTLEHFAGCNYDQSVLILCPALGSSALITLVTRLVRNKNLAFDLMMHKVFPIYQHVNLIFIFLSPFS